MTAAALLTNLIWIARDEQAPPWDQAHYLHISFEWRRAVDTGSIDEIVSSFFHTDGTYAPLYTLVISPFQAISEGVDSSLVANTLILCATVVVAAMIATHLFGSRSALPAAVFTATQPLVVGLSRTTLVDALLVLLVALAVLAAILSDGFRERRWTVACGIVVGLAILTKVTAPGILALPLLGTLALAAKMDWRRQLTNAAVATGVAALVALPWFAVNFSPTLDYIESTTSGSLAIGTTGDPLSYAALRAFAEATIEGAVGLTLLATLLVAGLLAARRLRGRGLDRRDVARWAIPVVWFAGPVAVLAVSHNQDIRYLAPGLTGLTVLTAGAIAAIRPRVVANVVFGVAAAVMVTQSVTWLTSELRVPFEDTDSYYQRRPDAPDYATPVLRALERRQRARGLEQPLNPCLLVTHEVVNGNTLGFVAETRGTPLAFTDLSYVPHLDDRQLAAALASCPTALYIPADPAEPGRVGTLNRASAAARITRSQLAAFDGPRSTFRVGPGVVAQLLTRAP